MGRADPAGDVRFVEQGGAVITTIGGELIGPVIGAVAGQNACTAVLDPYSVDVL